MIKLMMQQSWLLTACLMAEKEMSAIKESLSNGTLKSPRFQTNQENDIILGHIGELAFRDYLVQHDIPFKESPHVLGVSDEFDLVINDNKVDVKTCLRMYPLSTINSNFRLMIQKDQVGLHGDIVVWVLVHGYNVYEIKEVHVVGWIRSSRIKEFPLNKDNVSPAYWIPLVDVNDVKELEFID